MQSFSSSLPWAKGLVAKKMHFPLAKPNDLFPWILIKTAAMFYEKLRLYFSGADLLVEGGGRSL